MFRMEFVPLNFTNARRYVVTCLASGWGLSSGSAPCEQHVFCSLELLDFTCRFEAQLEDDTAFVCAWTPWQCCLVFLWSLRAGTLQVQTACSLIYQFSVRRFVYPLTAFSSNISPEQGEVPVEEKDGRQRFPRRKTIMRELFLLKQFINFIFFSFVFVTVFSQRSLFFFGLRL
jgi:hypothetical protein